MNNADTPEDAVLRRMIKDAERAYNKLEKPTFHRVSMGNDPKQTGIDCSEFQPTERTTMGNFCFQDYLIRMNQEATDEYECPPHSINTKNK